MLFGPKDGKGTGWGQGNLVHPVNHFVHITQPKKIFYTVLLTLLMYANNYVTSYATCIENI